MPNFNLKTEYPDVIKFWNYKLNKLKPENYTPVSGAFVWWNCSRDRGNIRPSQSSISRQIKVKNMQNVRKVQIMQKVQKVQNMQNVQKVQKNTESAKRAKSEKSEKKK